MPIKISRAFGGEASSSIYEPVQSAQSKTEYAWRAQIAYFAKLIAILSRKLLLDNVEIKTKAPCERDVEIFIMVHFLGLSNSDVGRIFSLDKNTIRRKYLKVEQIWESVFSRAIVSNIEAIFEEYANVLRDISNGQF